MNIFLFSVATSTLPYLLGSSGRMAHLTDDPILFRCSDVGTCRNMSEHACRNRCRSNVGVRPVYLSINR
uniref:Uncharacterized protein n=1 Tax=Picea glauca TaxID=3330 RepID=A0A117NH85_PICGL|nr:hypothetical protein ABT39_MTgene4968 [Picea glauca]QHR90400.1 hypothetical protein Q903MT_gene4423 [Picea sitchensis]